jgi:hypothetical protein
MSVELLLGLVGAVATIVGGFWCVVAVAGKQFEKRLDERFAAQELARQEGRKLYETRLANLEGDHRELERAFLKHLSELPREYMRREDHIRFETVINAKLDALAAKQDLLAERLLKRD